MRADDLLTNAGCHFFKHLFVAHLIVIVVKVKHSMPPVNIILVFYRQNAPVSTGIIPLLQT